MQAAPESEGRPMRCGSGIAAGDPAGPHGIPVPANVGAGPVRRVTGRDPHGPMVADLAVAADPGHRGDLRPALGYVVDAVVEHGLVRQVACRGNA